jgi:hypothetical protein
MVESVLICCADGYFSENIPVTQIESEPVYSEILSYGVRCRIGSLHQGIFANFSRKDNFMI